MKEVIGKINQSGSGLLAKHAVNKNSVTSEIGKTTESVKFFKNIGPELGRKIPTASRTFKGFLNKIDTSTPTD